MTENQRWLLSQDKYNAAKLELLITISKKQIMASMKIIEVFFNH